MPRTPCAFALGPRAIAVLVALHCAMTAAAFRAASTADAGVAAAEEPLKMYSKQPPKALARALYKRFDASGAAQISAVGPVAAYRALKAANIVNTKYKQTTGKVLAFVPTMRDAVLENGEQVKGWLFDVRAMPDVAVVQNPNADAEGDTDPTDLANVIFELLQSHKEVTVGAMGVRATYNALMAAVGAQDKMGSAKIGLLPSFVEVEEDGKGLSRMHLACVRV